MKKKSLSGIEKEYYRMSKHALVWLYFNIKNFASLLGKVWETFFFCAYVWKFLSQQTEECEISFQVLEILPEKKIVLSLS